jgi:hypothetical protein
VADRLVVTGCSSKAARWAVEQWHYSRTMPVGKLVRLGVWEHGEFVGAVIFGLGASPHLARSLDVKGTECCELVRVALKEHEAPVTEIVAEAIRVLRRHSPGLRLVVSFADPFHGHVGRIYQAGNWLYLGTTAPATAYRDRRGKLHHSRVVTGSGYVVQFGRMTKVPKPSDLTKVELPGKHRYAMPLDRALRRRLARVAQPYPLVA